MNHLLRRTATSHIWGHGANGTCQLMGVEVDKDLPKRGSEHPRSGEGHKGEEESTPLEYQPEWVGLQSPKLIRW